MSDSAFESTPEGGKRRSLRRADEIVGLTLDDPARITDLFECVLSDEEIVRMRASDALDKVCRQQPSLVAPFTDRPLSDVSRIGQRSLQWRLAQMLAELPLAVVNWRRAIAIFK